MIRLEDLHESYAAATIEERIQMANLGAICWNSLKQELYDQWSASLSVDESQKAEMWRSEGIKEGKQMMFESVKAKLASADTLKEQLMICEASREADRTRAEQQLSYERELLTKEIQAIKQRHLQNIEIEVDRRVADVVRSAEDRKDQEASALRLRIATLMEENTISVMLDSSRSKKITSLECELSEQLHMNEEAKRTFSKELSIRLEQAKEFQMLTLQNQTSSEISGLRQQIAELRSQSELLLAKEEARRLLEQKVSHLELENAMKQAKIDTLLKETTKSSYAIGKDGEALIYDVITEYVLPVFLYSRAKNMSGINHVADIHLFLQSPVGKQLKILIDAKNYKDHVKTKEITKLQYDVDIDDDANAGIMISTNSQISSVKQFQIEKTPKGKYILYLSIEGFDDELRGKAICWAVRVLSTLASYSDDSDGNILGKIVDFFKELDISLKEADQVVKSCQKTLEISTTMKQNLSKRLDDFRIAHLADVKVQHIEPETTIKPPRVRAARQKKSPVKVSDDSMPASV
jgi:hypothetical protein